MLGTGLVIGGAVVGYMVKNAKCLSRIETEIKGIKTWMQSHQTASDTGMQKLNELDKKVAVIDSQVNPEK